MSTMRKMYVSFLLIATSALVGHAQEEDMPSDNCEVYGCPEDFTEPPLTTDPGGINPEDVILTSTTKSSMLTNKKEEHCICLPYYLCNDKFEAVHAHNCSVIGCGKLDLRFDDAECQESVENCCTNPKKPEEVSIPVPDPSRLQGCGYRNSKGIDFTFIGGSGAEALFGEFPWVVALLNSSDNSYAGVGVLIHPQVVMTVAHIASRYDAGKMMIRAGEWDTQTSKERLPHQQRLVQEILVHPDFVLQMENLHNDIALLKLNAPVELSDHINVICMPSQDENFSDAKNCVANGWGKDKFGVQGRYAVILKKIEQDIVPRRDCAVLLRRSILGKHFLLHNSLVCSGGQEGEDTCQGDGGAPLACPIGNDRYKLTGLVAGGAGCGRKDVPAVNTAVAKFRDWVDSAMVAWGYNTTVYSI